jgi:hypothetical protein
VKQTETIRFYTIHHIFINIIATAIAAAIVDTTLTA